jgi:ribosomal-protein-alanine N-acetyltransferase
MSALWRGRAEPARAADAPVLVPMTVAQLEAVLAIEAAAYAFPWSRGNFIDSLAAGYPARVLVDARGALLGYFVAMGGVDEMHLLNITVAPAAQGRGHARVLIDALVGLCRAQPAGELWLEVRASNGHARAMYQHLGFAQVGVRKGYYPAPFGRREDAIVMSLKIAAAAPGGEPDALG